MKNITLLVAATLAIAGCKDKGGGGQNTSGAAMAKMTELKDEMCKCKDAKCAQDVSDKLTRWGQDQAKNQTSPPKMSEADTKKAAALGEEMAKCMQLAMSSDATPPAGSAASGTDTATGSGAGGAAGADGLPAECAAYKAQVEKLKTCDRLPPKAKDALVKAFNDASAGWASMPEGAKAGLATSCKAGTEAIVGAAKDACGW